MGDIIIFAEYIHTQPWAASSYNPTIILKHFLAWLESKLEGVDFLFM